MPARHIRVVHSLTVELGRFPISHRQRILGGLLGLAVLVGVAALNELAFRALLDTDYPRWYLDNGAVIGFVFTLLTLAAGDINRISLLISANPLEYVAASLELLIAPLSSVGAMIRPDRPAWRAQRTMDEAHHRLARSQEQLRRGMQELAADPNLPEEIRRRYADSLADFPAVQTPESEDAPNQSVIVPTGLPVVDNVLALLFVWAFALAILAWLLLVVPLQYFVYLVTGAPARVACAAPQRAWVESEENVSGGQESIFAVALKSDLLPKGAIESGFTAKPVTFTAGITTAVLFAVSRLT